MAIEWGLTSVLMKLVSLLRGTNKSLYFNNKRDEVVFTLAEKLYDTKLLLRTHPHAEGEQFEELTPQTSTGITPYIRFNQVGSEFYDRALKPVFLKLPVCLADHLYHWKELSVIANNIYLPQDVKEAIDALDFTRHSIPPTPVSNIPVNHLLLTLPEYTLDETFYQLPENICRNFGEYYQLLLRLKRAVLKATKGKLKSKM